MGLVLIGVLVIIVGIIMAEGFDLESGEMIFWFGIVLTVVVLMTIPVSRLSVNVGMVKFESVQTSILEARQNDDISEFELATLQQKVVEKNEWLTENKYWAKHWLCNWHYPTKKINALEPIR